MGFFRKIQRITDRNDSLVCIGLDPNPDLIPERYRTGHSAHPSINELLAWNQAIVAETIDLVCAFKPNIAFYEALGLQGMRLLQKTLELIPPDIPVLLDAKRGDIGSTAAAYAKAYFEELQVDALTLSPYLGSDSIEPFAAYEDKGLFVLCHTSNPGASDFQLLEISDWQTLDQHPNWPLYLHIASEAIQWSPNVGLVVGATYPQAMADVRTVAPDALILAPGIGSQGGDLNATLDAGLRMDGDGLLINASRTIAVADSHADAARTLMESINRARDATMVNNTATDTLSVSQTIARRPKRNHPVSIEDIVVSLAELDAIQFGEFVLSSGTTSPFYIDLRDLIGQPTLLKHIAASYTSVLRALQYDRISGVASAGLTIATALSIQDNVPMVNVPTQEQGSDFAGRIEGEHKSGERVVVIEAVTTSGGNILETAIRLRREGLLVEDAVVLIDREQSSEERLKLAGIRLHSLIGLSDLLHTLVARGQLTEDMLQDVIEFVGYS